MDGIRYTVLALQVNPCWEMHQLILKSTNVCTLFCIISTLAPITPHTIPSSALISIPTPISPPPLSPHTIFCIINTNKPPSSFIDGMKDNNKMVLQVQNWLVTIWLNKPNKSIIINYQLIPNNQSSSITFQLIPYIMLNNRFASTYWMLSILAALQYMGYKYP